MGSIKHRLTIIRGLQVCWTVLILISSSACRTKRTDLTSVAPIALEESIPQFVTPVNGLADGIHKQLWGKDTVYFQLKDALKEGYSKCFFRNGKVHYQGPFLNDQLHGWWETFNEQGDLVSAGTYRNGLRTGLWREYNKNGSIYREGYLVNGMMNGWWRINDTEGKPSREGHYTDGVPDGHHLHFEGGSLREEGNMDQGKRTGRWTRYDEQGQPVQFVDWS